ncbi:MAG: hypothetical protein A2Y12_09610 [Planctomycetes bacterium GWF2_42_9]|nr:MAG: hypothetical protein A2Y12_09610 [Planctomycetes bacterium GWF2_42_9]
MISCTEFIPAYNELFVFLENKADKQAVVTFWESLSDKFLYNLREIVKAKGVAGCFEYWSRTLAEEAADCKITLDENADEFTIEMKHCPSKGRLISDRHVKPYHSYCEHCDILYRRVLETLGLEYSIDLSNCGNAQCRLVARNSIRPKV